MGMQSQSGGSATGDVRGRLFGAAFGGFLGLSLLKFGNPPIMQKFVGWPGTGYEWLLSGWPLTVGYALLVPVCLLGLLAMRWWIPVQKWLVALPVAWLAWQFVSATRTVDAELTRETLKHFSACVVCYYLGLFALGSGRSLMAFWAGLLGGFIVVIAAGFDQHFGGLDETRKYFFAYVYPQMPNVPPEYLKKISSDRVFSTLFYPNALAGVLLLLSPTAVAAIWKVAPRLTTGARVLLVGLIGVASLACLYWSGSKGGWLLAMVIGLVAMIRGRIKPRWKLALIALVLACGLAGFAWKYAAFFQRGATSVSARFDYWQAAVRTATANPILGTGPGTFAIPYARIKRPESEMARLVHNDYLEQATDSGWPGFAVYLGFIVVALWEGRPRSRDWSEAVRNAVWLGCLGWSLQGIMEFGLYVPALAWTAFALLGWLGGSQSGLPSANQFDTRSSSG